MANETPKDPGAIFNEWVTQWERNFDAFANKVMGTEGFSQAMNETQKAQLKMQGMFTQFMTEQLANMNMPTRDDVLRLGEAITAVDRRLERIEEKLALDGKKKSSKKKPARTKKPAAEAGGGQ
jgi:hypothetical protein